MQRTNRIRQKEMEDAIWIPDGKKVKKSLPDGVLVFTLLGMNDGRVDENGAISDDGYPVLSDAEDKEGNLVPAEDLEYAYAKSINSNNKTRYLIKRHNSGRLFNPLDKYLEHRHSKDLHVNRDITKWSEVNRDTFIHYLKFLTTRNQAWLTTAQRELI